MNWARRFIQFNIRLSNNLDALLPARFCLDGNSDFQKAAETFSIALRKL